MLSKMSTHIRAVPPLLIPAACSHLSLRSNGFPQIQRTAEELLAVVGRRAKAGQTLDLDRLMMRETLDVLGRCVMVCVGARTREGGLG